MTINISLSVVKLSVPNDYINNINRRLRYSNLSISESVMNAFKSIPRHLFVDSHHVRTSYQDTPLPIKSGQTISAPHMYAMTLSEELNAPRKHMDILEIGTGSGYGVALLAHLVRPKIVYSIERHASLFEFAKNNLKNAGITNVELILGDGTLGISHMSFDRIIVTAVGPKIPNPLIEQLKENGKMIIPLQVGSEQWLSVISKDNGKIVIDKKFRVRFVKLIGKEGF